jgi:hypothetical protein
MFPCYVKGGTHLLYWDPQNSDLQPGVHEDILGGRQNNLHKIKRNTWTAWTLNQLTNISHRIKVLAYQKQVKSFH